jgi:hypothetical protein
MRQVSQFHSGKELNGIIAQSATLDDTCIGQLDFQTVYTPFQFTLLTLGSMIFEVFAQIALVSGL